MNKFLSKRANSLTPYVPGEQLNDDNIIKLNTNENPYPVSPKAMDAMQNAVTANLKKYSKPECNDLRQAIADVEDLPSIDYVYAGNGSDEVLAFCFYAFFNQDKDVVFPDITYSFYPVYCNLHELSYREIPLDDKLKINVDDYKNLDCAGIIFANPNAPTGELLSLDEIKVILESNKDKVVIVDEAYIEFGGKTAVKLIPDYDNLVVIRTMSKSHSLAGLRCGYVMAQPHLIDGVIWVKNSFNSYSLDTICQSGATNAILDYEYMKKVCDKVVATREYFVKEIKELGFSTTNSSTNFIFVTHPRYKAVDIYQFLKYNNILVRHFTKPKRISDYLRISIGTDSDMEKVILKLKEFVTMR